MGEMSFFDRQARSARIRAGSAGTRLLKLTRTMYKRLRAEQPFIAVNLLEHAIISLDHLFRRLSMGYCQFQSVYVREGADSVATSPVWWKERGGRRDAEFIKSIWLPDYCLQKCM